MIMIPSSCILIALCASTFAHSEFKSCLTCTEHTDKCIYIGNEDFYSCINKIHAHNHDFDYMSELPSDCNTSFIGEFTKINVYINCELVIEHELILKRLHIHSFI